MASAAAVDKLASVYESSTENPKVRKIVGLTLTQLGKSPGLMPRCVAAFLDVSGRCGDDVDIRIHSLDSLARLVDAMPIDLQRKSFMVTRDVLTNVADDLKLRIFAVQVLVQVSKAGGASSDEASDVLAEIASNAADAEDVRIAAADFIGKLI